MNDSTLEASPLFAARRFAAQAAVDHALTRAELVALVVKRRRQLAERKKEFQLARLRLEMAELGLRQLDEGRAPA